MAGDLLGPDCSDAALRSVMHVSVQGGPVRAPCSHGEKQLHH